MIDLIIFCFCTASLSHFFQKTQEEGMIFELYGNLLDKLPPFIAAPLGRCVVCNGTWIFIVLYFWQHLPQVGDKQFVLYLFLGIGINYILIRIFGKIITDDPE